MHRARPPLEMRAAAAIATALVTVLNGPLALAAPGQLDLSFGGDGKVTTNFTSGRDAVSGVAIQSADGKIVVAGTANSRGRDARFALARYETDGALDPTFGGDGKVTTNFTPAWDGAFSVAIQPSDGKIVAAGEAGGTGPTEAPTAKFALARYDTDGTLDTTFGGDGKVITNIAPGADFTFGIVIQPADGKIVVAGRAGGAGGRFALARYNPNGSLDQTFGGDGKVLTNFTPRDDRADELALQADGKIVVAGTADYFSNRGRFALVRYETDGSLDVTFRGDGKLTTDFTRSFDGAFSVTVQGNGKIVAAGQTGGGDAGRFGLARYEADGTIDPTFGGDGRVTTNLTTRLDYAEEVVIQPGDGKIIAGGAARFFGPRSLFALVRYETNGLRDATFGGDGRVTTSFSANGGGIFGLAIQPADSRIVAVGRAGGLGGRFGVARYLP